MKNLSFFRLPILIALYLVLTAEYCDVTSLSVPCSVTAGSSFPIKSVVHNLTNFEGVSPVYYIFSNDRFLNPEDDTLGQDNVALPAFGHQTSVVMASLGASIYSGKYFVIAKPHGSTVGMMYREIEVIGQPNNGTDYVPTNLRIEGNRFFFTLQNVGLQSADPCFVSCYISPNQILDADDLLVSKPVTNFPMPGNSRWEITGSFNYPANMPFDTYYFIVSADNENNVQETVESNNRVSLQFKITSNYLDKPAEERSALEDPGPALLLFPVFISPNPASDFVNISFNLEKPSSVAVEVYDQAGHLVTKLPEQEFEPGEYSERVDLVGKPNGVYVVRATVNGQPVTRKIVVQR